MTRFPEVDVYDFDKTIYEGDCSLDFWRFCVGRRPSLLKYFPAQIAHTLLFAAKIEKRTAYKEHFFRFLRGLGNTAEQVDMFWDEHYRKIGDWYLRQDHSKDVIISASPEFLVEPAFRKLGAYKLIATRMDPKSGRIDGENCRGEEKVRRLKECFGEPRIRRAYSDSLSDLPILRLAKEPHLVKRGNASPLSLPDPLD